MWFGVRRNFNAKYLRAQDEPKSHPDFMSPKVYFEVVTNLVSYQKDMQCVSKALSEDQRLACRCERVVHV